MQRRNITSQAKLASDFGHSSGQIEFWRKLVRPLTRAGTTPFYLFSLAPIQDALAELNSNFSHLPIRHWLSFKTQPLRPLVQWWQQQGYGVEVVSEFEFRAVLAEKFAAENILLNGPAKHRWLLPLLKKASQCELENKFANLSLNFDSVSELKTLLPFAKKLNWRVGVRINTREEFDPENPSIATQFGFQRDEALAALKKLRSEKVRLEMVHFHLRTNIKSPDIYRKALDEVHAICDAAKFSPRYIDCGGGFPPAHVLTRDGVAVNAEFSLKAAADVYRETLNRFPSAEEIWLENGRWLSARSGVLVIKILDVKERTNMRYLICDGGRTMNAMLSTWEQHALISLENRTGKHVPTTVNGPTCMAFDQIARRPLPNSLRTGDHLLWLDAGAYHLPWQTRFSHGLPAVYWNAERTTASVRKPETFEHWWNQ